MKVDTTLNIEIVEKFLGELKDELKYFNITLDRVKKANWIIGEYRYGKLVGIAGIEKKLGIVRSWTIVKKEHWKKGIGSKLVKKRREKCLKDRSCHVLLGVVEKNNIPSIKNIIKQGYLFCGRKGNLLYYFQPITSVGKLMILILKVIFPITKIIDRFRKKNHSS